MKRLFERFKRVFALFMCLLMLPFSAVAMWGCAGEEEGDEIVLRVSNWEEYIDLGDWDEEDIIELEDGTVIFPEQSLVEDFEDWFYETYGKKVRVEYSTFGTNEELYNQITLGDSYDLVCPSEYMIMKMMEEDMLTPYSEEFYDKSIEENHYSKNVSPYINDVFKKLEFSGKTLDKYAAGYMWGTLGIVYNPEEVTEEEAAHWNILLNDKFAKQITIKDSVRDAFFAGVSIYYYDKITKDSFVAQDNYNEILTNMLNSTDKKTVDGVEKILSKIKDNVYAFETDSGKADLVTGKVVANQQWSGDAVYTLDQAEEEGTILCYSVPKEASNIWFDGWVMLKDSVEGDADKRLAAEAFVNYVSMEENAIRNMMYIGYTSTIAGDKMFQYADWCYGADVEEAEAEGEELIEYDVNYFFARENETSDESENREETGEDADDGYIITAYADQANRQLFSQYPTLEVMERCAVMAYFNKKDNAYINRMWTNVRCFDLDSLFE